ncbi:MerR family transcriptional regulator [Halosquirtibacter xylanolyticus]|uniref:MerR family transcriptional regulator n=1 Tax=Halosquirtibacter xylanolyticus TaxID=3374599 RepID=UPI003747B174|nr:MerR family transcriptional regulator [Prolixibacteraceae bacterium]
MKDLKTYYSIGEVAEMFNVNVSLIRYWSNTFKQIQPHTNKKGNRLFTPKDLETLKLVYHFVKEKGMTLKGAQQKLKEQYQGEDPNLEVISRLLKIKEQLVNLRDQLDKKESNDQDTADN